jgi:hypothetical protein
MSHILDNYHMLIISRFFQYYSQLVFPKRAAMLLDRLMVALHHALEDEDPKEIKKINELYRNGQLSLPNSPLNSNLSPPKYFKGKSERDAYYGYKLINGQTGECFKKEFKFTLSDVVIYWCKKLENMCFKIPKNSLNTTSANSLNLISNNIHSPSPFILQFIMLITKYIECLLSKNK